MALMLAKSPRSNTKLMCGHLNFPSVRNVQLSQVHLIPRSSMLTVS